VLADPTNLHQIVMNLVTNAYHAVEQTSGTIEIGLRQRELSGCDVLGTSLAAGSYAELSVRDSGYGITPEAIHKIFEPYFTTKPKGKGTGLGLSVVYGHVKDHGGDIRVVSQVGRGTTFEVYFPLLKREEEAILPEKMVIHATGSERILLVDDEVPIARMEKQMLERLGYRVTSHTRSLDALETFKSDPSAYDLVITDVTMPHMTGDQLALRLTAIRPDLPVIIVTGFSERLDERRANLGGAIKGVLLKPVVAADLARLVRQVLDDSRNRVSAGGNRVSGAGR
jgi:CheY-like chemotaxis protein